MIKGTTPTHRFEISFSTENIKDILITYAQKNQIILQKQNDACSKLDIDGKYYIYTQLTEEESNLFIANVPTDVQIRLTLVDGHIIKSCKLMIFVRKAYDEIGE